MVLLYHGCETPVNNSYSVFVHQKRFRFIFFSPIFHQPFTHPSHCQQKGRICPTGHMPEAPIRPVKIAKPLSNQ